jgi:hypothetical protein
VRINSSIKIDGLLDDKAWQQASLLDAFIQREPLEGESVSERTEIKIMYDENNLYLAARCWDSEADKIVADVMRRDMYLLNNDCIEIYLDTYHDHRTAFCFCTNALGAQRDGEVVPDLSEELQNWDWNGIWENVSRIDSSGWTAEIAIPFKTLRFSTGPEMVWGFNVARYIPRKREEAYWSPVLREYGYLGKYRIADYGHLTGLQDIKHPEKVQIKPYALSGIERDLEINTDYEKRFNLGLDAKYLLTPNLTFDVTVNTDFAQVEADQEQVNLTRFELFYPEKREFFLEGASIFRLGERTLSPLTPPNEFFFSRRIGLSEDNELVPLIGGIRLTGKTTSYNIGLLNIFADRTRYYDEDDNLVEIPRTNFSTLRIQKDVMQKSAIGIMGTNKESLDNDYYNRSAALDANIFLTENTQVGGYLAKTFTPDLVNKDLAGYIDFYHSDDLLNIFVSQNSIGENFNPELGFFPRTGIRKSQIELWVSPRPGILSIRQLFIFNNFMYITDQQQQLETRKNYTGLFSDFDTGAYFFIIYVQNYERLTEEFEIHEDVIIPIDIYRFNYIYSELQSDRSKSLAARLIFSSGGFFDGHLTEYGIMGDIKFGSQLTVNLELDVNDVRLPYGNFRTTLLGTRIIYSFTPNVFIKPYLQWNSETNRFISNVLFNFIHTPGSDLYFVYNEELKRESNKFVSKNRTFVVKFTYLFNF